MTLLLRSLQPADMKDIPRAWQHCCCGTSVHSVEIEGVELRGFTDSLSGYNKILVTSTI